VDISHNPSGTPAAIEGITSPCGCVFGKMAPTERSGPFVDRNILGNKEQPLFHTGRSSLYEQ
jgi:phosphoribosylformylglycinamidine synthase